MKAIAGLCLLVAVLGCGCSQNSSSNSASSTPPPAASANTADPSPANAPAGYLGGLANAQNKAVKTVDVASLNQALQMYNVQEGHFPKSLNELIDQKFITKLPDVPAGMKLSYDPDTGKVTVLAE